MAEEKENPSASLLKAGRSEIELESVPELLNKVKRLDIDYFDWSREAGGIIMGHREYGPLTPTPLQGGEGRVSNNWKFEVDGLLQMPNASKKKEFYKVPNIIRFSWHLLKWYAGHGVKLADGVMPIGEFHSDYYGNLGFSKQDMELIMKRCKRHGIWVTAVMVHKHRNIGKMMFKVHKYNGTSLSRKPGRGMR